MLRHWPAPVGALSPPQKGGTKRLKRSDKKTGKKSGAAGKKDGNTTDELQIFVAGSTGRLGLRIVRQLLLAGFKVRAGVRNKSRAQGYLDTAAELGLLSPDALKRLELVTVDLEEADTIVEAIGPAAKVVQAIGAAESNVLDFGAPKRIDGDAAINLVTAAVQSDIEQYVMVTSLGTGKFGWPAGALNLFGGILVQKRRAERELEESGLPYVIVRPGGMERPTDEYKLTNNVRLQTRDSLFGGQVSRLQVAELITAAVSNPELAENKVLEVVAEEEAEDLPYAQLLEYQPSEASQEERVNRLKLQEETSGRLAALQRELEDAEEAKQEAYKIVQQFQTELEEKQRGIRDVESDTVPLLSEAEQLDKQLDALRKEASQAALDEKVGKALLSASRSGQREGKTLTSEDKQRIAEPILSASKPAPAPQEPSANVRGKRQVTPKATVPAGQQEALAEDIPKKEIALKLGKAGPRPSKAERRLAEDIPKQEIALKLGKAGPEPSEGEKRLAEGISQKEIAMGSGRDGLEASEQPQEDGSLKKAKRADRPAPRAPAQKSAPKPAAPKMSAEDVQQQQAARNRSRDARADREAAFLARLEEEREQELKKKTQASQKRADEALATSAKERKALLAKQQASWASLGSPSKPASKPAKAKTTASSATSSAPQSSSKTADRASQQQLQQQAENNAKDARAWIDAWRQQQSTTSNGGSDNGGSSAAIESTAASNGVRPESKAAGNGNGSSSSASDGAKEAQAWIAAWRERSASSSQK